MPHRINAELQTHTVNVAFTGDTRDFTTSDDSFRMGSQAATHWDALAHAGYDERLYNDTPSAVVTAEAGAARLGIEHFGPVATRGVLLDIARLHGVDHFDDNYADHRRRSRTGKRRGAGRRSSRATRCSCAPARCTSCAAGDEDALLDAVARAVDAVDRVAPRPRRRRGRDRHADVRGLPVRGPGRLHAGAHDPPARHGTRAGPELATSTTSPPTARPTASTTSCSSRRRSR